MELLQVDLLPENFFFSLFQKKCNLYLIQFYWLAATKTDVTSVWLRWNEKPSPTFYSRLCAAHFVSGNDSDVANEANLGWCLNWANCVRFYSRFGTCQDCRWLRPRLNLLRLKTHWFSHLNCTTSWHFRKWVNSSVELWPFVAFFAQINPNQRVTDFCGAFVSGGQNTLLVFERAKRCWCSESSLSAGAKDKKKVSERICDLR